MKLNKYLALFAGCAFYLSATIANAADPGRIIFDTVKLNPNTTIDASKGQVLFNGVGVGSTFLGQIYVSTSLNGTYTAIGTAQNFFDAEGAGYIQGPNLTVPGSSIGSQVFYQLRAWNASAGSTFEQAAASSSAILGISESVQVTLGGTIPGDPPTVVPFPSSNLHSSFSLAAVPEPTTVALAVMGGLGLLARRRRNQA